MPLLETDWVATAGMGEGRVPDKIVLEIKDLRTLAR
jgi:hypothetical protein